MPDCECQCAEGAPVGWRKIPGGGRGLPFGQPFGPGLGPGFGGGFGANNNNNNNNNNSSNNNNASNNMMSALSNLLGLNSLNGLSGFGGCGPGFGPGFGGFGPFGGFGGFPFGGCGGFGFPPPPGPGCCCGPDQDCCCPPGPCCCGPCPPCPPPDCQPCNSVCWKQFKIVSPGGKECCFPVAVPWWCCGDSATGTSEAAAQAIETPAETIGQVLREPAAAAKDGCMSASQLLMQRYMIANPPRAFGRQAAQRAPIEMEVIGCPECENGEPSPQFAAAMAEFQRNAVLIPSEEA